MTSLPLVSSAPSPSPIQPLVLQADKLTKRFGQRTIVHEISFHLQAGEIVGLLGPNGAGKSTTFHMLTGLIRPDGGTVRLGEQLLTHFSLAKRARLGLGYLPQEATIFRGLTAQDNLLCVLESRMGQSTRAEQFAKIDAMLQAYQLNHVRHIKGDCLSGGERRRLEMARAMLCEPSILLLDEPFAGVDPIAVQEIQRFIQTIQHQQVGVLLTDHNVRETLRICHRAYLIAEGRILAQGTPAEIIAHPDVKRVYLGQDFVF